MSLTYAPHDVIREDAPDGSIRLRARAALGPMAARTTDWLDHWASATPDAVFLAERAGDGWRELTYAEARDAALAVARVLVGMGLGPGDPILILTGNSVAHGLLSLGAQYVGVPFVPLAEQYAAIPAARAQIDTIAGLVKPAAVFVEDVAALADVLARPALAGLPVITPEILEAAAPDVDIDAARGAVGPETVAKILMTSGSTSAPKGVPTTHRMMCANQAQIAACLPFLRARPPVLVDWLPWNHVFGGSHNFNLVLANGGALYIDDGKPVPHLLPRMIENNRLKRATIAFNVPVGFAALRDAMAADPDFAAAFFGDLDMLFYAGASLPQDVWADLEAMARAARGGAMPLFTSSWGLTETAPAAVLQHQPSQASGVVGVPLPGVEVKLLPDTDGRCEVRVKGPNIFTGYFNDPARSAEAFDADGFFQSGDAMRFVDPGDPAMGLRFDGRIAEDFKLMTGIWVRAATLRLHVLQALKGLAQDVVLVGDGHAEVGALILPTAGLRAECQPDGGALLAPDAGQVAMALAGLEGGSAGRVARALILADPPSIAEGEMTAKGNLNFAKVKARRSELIARLYDDCDGAVIRVEGA